MTPRTGIVPALLLLLASAVGAADTDEGFEDPVLNERYRALIREVRCPKCQNESIADSDAPVAADLRREIRKQIAAGASDEDVTQFLLARYGDFVLYRPQVKPTTWALYAGPFVLLAVGGVVFWRILRTRSAQPLDEDPLT
jgi:cytochrome c-type biogenesis protein CcmH